jgi:tRNA pseudouridine38-40 synthase
MARYKLILAYDGTRFAGSQRQAKPRTVQGELENALRDVGWSGRSVVFAGRTDRGVHAAGQVVAFDFEWPHTAERLQTALNANLAADIAVQRVKLAGPEFHPRFDALSRSYRYRLFCRDVRDPLREKLAWRVWPAIDPEKLLESARVFLGPHNFRAFGSPMHANGSTLRTVEKSEWKKKSGEWQFEIEADAFLYRMVRRLVFVQVAVAQARCSVTAVAQALEIPESAKLIPAGLAPAHGLTLIKVMY